MLNLRISLVIERQMIEVIYQSAPTFGSFLVKWLLIIILIYALSVILIHMYPGIVAQVSSSDESSSISSMIRS